MIIFLQMLYYTTLGIFLGMCVLVLIDLFNWLRGK